MNKKISLEKIFFDSTFYYPVVTLFLATFFPYFPNKFYILYVVISFVYYIKKVGIQNGKKMILLISIISFYVFYDAWHSGISYILHLDFYCFLGFCLTAILTSEDKVYYSFKHYLKQRKSQFLLITIIILLLIVYSFAYSEGNHYNFGVVGFKILYGPYEIPHNIAYLSLLMYAFCMSYYKGVENIMFALIKIVFSVCVILTGVRSAFLSLAILMFVDFYYMKKSRRKYFILIVVFLLFCYIICFTDILFTNPIIQKTLVAAKAGNITNSRGTIARIVLNSYINNTTWYEKIFGMGIDGVRNAMLVGLGVLAHGHNDYVNSLCGYGIIGFIIYFFCQIKIGHVILNKKNKIWLEICLFILIFSNGLAMYIVITPCIPIFVIAFEELGKHCLNLKYENEEQSCLRKMKEESFTN